MILQMANFLIFYLQNTLPEFLVKTMMAFKWKIILYISADAYLCSFSASPSLAIQSHLEWRAQSRPSDGGYESGERCGIHHNDPHSHIRQFFICLFYFPFGWYCRLSLASRQFSKRKMLRKVDIASIKYFITLYYVIGKA